MLQPSDHDAGMDANPTGERADRPSITKLLQFGSVSPRDQAVRSPSVCLCFGLIRTWRPSGIVQPHRLPIVSMQQDVGRFVEEREPKPVVRLAEER